jgi:serine/threonine-protein kinase RsbW
MSDAAFQNLMLALTEAISNAIIHGNRSDASRSVTLRIERDDDQIRCTIRDQGPGYDPDELADPTEPENLLREGGRGVFIIRSLSSRFMVKRTSDGTSVVFCCARS